MKEWHSKISGAKYATISSAFGHDGFLLENEQLTNIFKEIICKS
jgi:homoserine acetyltransferase